MNRRRLLTAAALAVVAAGCSGAAPEATPSPPLGETTPTTVLSDEVRSDGAARPAVGRSLDAAEVALLRVADTAGAELFDRVNELGAALVNVQTAIQPFLDADGRVDGCPDPDLAPDPLNADIGALFQALDAAITAVGADATGADVHDALAAFEAHEDAAESAWEDQCTPTAP